MWCRTQKIKGEKELTPEFSISPQLLILITITSNRIHRWQDIYSIILILLLGLKHSVI